MANSVSFNHSKMGIRPTLLVALASLFLGGCDYFGIEAPANLEARLTNEAKAVGGACRQAGRAIEDCFTLNPQMPRSAVLAGWRDMNDYMTENHLEPIRPELPPPTNENKTPSKPSSSPAPNAPTASGAQLPI